MTEMEIIGTSLNTIEVGLAALCTIIVFIVIVGMVYIFNWISKYLKVGNMILISKPNKTETYYCEKTDTCWSYEEAEYTGKYSFTKCFKSPYYGENDYNPAFIMDTIQLKYHDLFIKAKLKAKYESQLSTNLKVEMQKKVQEKYKIEEKKMKEKLGIKEEPTTESSNWGGPYRMSM